MAAMNELLLEPGRWYGWQMLPGYLEGVPYFSPILLRAVSTREEDHLELEFLNALYTAGVQDFQISARVLLQARSYVVVELAGPPRVDTRSAVISAISFEWFETFCPTVVQAHTIGTSLGDVQEYLSSVLLG